VAYVLFVVNAGTNLPTPLYERYREAWGFSPAILTVIYALYALTLIPALPIFGSLSDRFERTRIMLAGLATIFLGSLVALFARNIAWLFAVRIIQGTALALVSGAASTALAELEPRGDHARSAMASTAALTAGGGAGVLLAGYLAEYAPAPLRTPFLVHLAILVPAIVGVVVMPRLGHRAASTSTAAGPAAAPTAAGPAPMTERQRRGVALACATSFLAFAVLALFLSLGPTIVKALLHDKSVLVGAYVALDMLGCSATVQLLARHATLRTKLLAGLVTLVVGLGAFVFAASSGSAVGVFVTTAVGGVGQGLSFLGAVELLERAAPPERHGKLVSVLYAASYAGGSVPVVAVGIGASTFGLLPALVTYAIVAAVAGLGLLAAVASFANRPHPLPQTISASREPIRFERGRNHDQASD
jgi:MFS family permease